MAPTGTYRRAIGGVLAGVALLAGGCGGPATSPSAHPTSPAPTVSTTAAAEFNGTDIAWLQLMTAMTERILPVLELAASRASEPAVRLLAADVKADHASELPRLRDLLVRAGATGANPHEGHDMPGMTTTADLAAMRRSAGADLHRRFATSVRAHADQCVRLARSEREAGTSAAVRKLAYDIERARLEHRARLDRLPAPGS